MTPEESVAIVARTVAVLREVYGEGLAQGIDSQVCGACAYPAPVRSLLHGRCPGCQGERS